MLDVIIQHLQLAGVILVAAVLIVFFGAIVAVAIYLFVMVHVWAYNISKEVINGIFSANA